MAVTLTITGGLIQLSGNPIELVLTADSAKPNHRLAVKVSCDQLLSPVQIEEIEPVDLVAKHQIQGLLDEPLSSEFDYPAVGKVTWHIALAIIATIDVGEVWTDETTGERQTSWMGLNQTIRVLNGRLRDYELKSLNEQGKSFASEYINGGKFLTNLPNLQTVAPRQMIKLWYLSRWPTNHTAELHFSINTNLQTVYPPITEEVILYGAGLFEFSMNPEHMGYYLPPGEQVTDYTFWLTDSEGDISERRTFKVIHNYYEKTFFAYYRNEFSAIDSIWLRGESKASLKTESETAYKPSDVGAGSKVPNLITVSSSGRRYWEINTGVLEEYEMHSLRGFLEAQERWLVDPENENKLIPVTIEGGDFLLFDTMQDIQNLAITLYEANKN